MPDTFTAELVAPASTTPPEAKSTSPAPAATDVPERQPSPSLASRFGVKPASPGDAPWASESAKESDERHVRPAVPPPTISVTRSRSEASETSAAAAARSSRAAEARREAARRRIVLHFGGCTWQSGPQPLSAATARQEGPL